MSSTAFTTLFGLAQGLGVILMVLVGIWLTHCRGGFGWTETPSLEFNWHPLLMTIGLIFLYGNSILVYRGFRGTVKRRLKFIHAGIHGTAFILTVIGLQAAFDSHNLARPPIPNMYSLHSWVGLAAVILFAAQFLGGFAAFLYPTLSLSTRTAIMPFHVFLGVAGFVLAIASALMGLSEKAIFSKAYEKLDESEWILVDVIGIFMVAFALVVVYLVTESRYRRVPLPEEQIIMSSPIDAASN